MISSIGVLNLRKRIVTNELIDRVHRAEETIYDWMSSNNILEATLESCIEVLVNNSLYKYDSKGRGHNFRKDLRTLRDKDLLETTFKRIAVKQKKPNTPWYIERNKEIIRVDKSIGGYDMAVCFPIVRTR